MVGVGVVVEGVCGVFGGYVQNGGAIESGKESGASES